MKDEDDFPLPSPTSIHRTVDIISPMGSFGLQLIGGTNTTLPAQVELVLPGMKERERERERARKGIILIPY